MAMSISAGRWLLESLLAGLRVSLTATKREKRMRTGKKRMLHVAAVAAAAAAATVANR